MKDELFELAVLASLRVPPKNVIGTQSEHRVHGALKYYFQPDDRFHEIRVGSFICDAVSEDESEIFEIQTRGFYRLKSKISALSADHKVSIIYPVIAEKRVFVTYADTGETNIRKSPKKGTLTDIFPELYALREFFACPNLSFTAVVISADETRTYKAKKPNRRPNGKPIKIERVPTDLLSVTRFSSPSDFASLLPEGLPDSFSVKDIAPLIRIDSKKAWYMLASLEKMGVLRSEKQGRKVVFFKE